MDWKQYSTDLIYATAKVRAKYIGKDLAKVLLKITYNMTQGTKNLHLIGHSMGAHIVGFTGKILANQIPRITGVSVPDANYIILKFYSFSKKITLMDYNNISNNILIVCTRNRSFALGLDPAKPLYEKSSPEDRLDINDALFVDVMHTNGGKNGILKSLGHIDFFPNGGQHQPNCKKFDEKSM